MLNQNKQPVVFKKERDFSALISDTIEFVKQEYKTLGKALLTYAGPFILVTSFLAAMYQNELYSNPDAFDPNNPMAAFQGIFSTKYYMFLFSGIISNVVLNLVVFAYILLYVNKGKDNFKQEDIWQIVGRHFAPVFFMLIAMSFMIGVGLFVFIVPGIYLMVVFSLAIFAHMNEELGFNNAISRSAFLIKNYWLYTLGVLIVIYLIAFAAGYIFLIPQVLMSSSYTEGIQAGNFEKPSAVFTMLSVIGTFGSSLIYAIIYITLPMHYYSLVQKREKPDLMNKIDDIQ